MDDDLAELMPIIILALIVLISALLILISPLFSVLFFAGALIYIAVKHGPGTSGIGPVAVYS